MTKEAMPKELRDAIDTLAKFSRDNRRGGWVPTEHQKGYNLALEHLGRRLERLENV